MIESIISNKQYETLLKAKKGECIKKVHGGTIRGLMYKRAIDEKYNLTEIGELLMLAHVKASDLAEQEFKKLAGQREEVDKLKKDVADFYNNTVKKKFSRIEELKKELNDIRASLLNDRELLINKMDIYKTYARAYNACVPHTHSSHRIDYIFQCQRFKHAAEYIKNGPHRSDYPETEAFRYD